MGVNGFMIVLEDLIFIYFNQIESNIICIGLNRIGEILDHERCFRNLQELNGQSELPGQNENLDDLFWDNILVHIF